MVIEITTDWPSRERTGDFSAEGRGGREKIVLGKRSQYLLTAKYALVAKGQRKIDLIIIFPIIIIFFFGVQGYQNFILGHFPGVLRVPPGFSIKLSATCKNVSHIIDLSFIPISIDLIDFDSTLKPS